MWTTTPERFEAEFEERVKRAMERAIIESANSLAGESTNILSYKQFLSTGFSGGSSYYEDGAIAVWMNEIRDSIHVNAISPTEYEIVMDGGHAKFIEEGTTPHWPPIAAIGAWAVEHNWDPYALQKYISEHGTHAHPFVMEGIERNLESIKQLFVSALVKELSEP